MKLADPLDDEAVVLLRQIYLGSSSGTADWPVWQWVASGVRRRGVDPEAALRALPEFQHHYGPVRSYSRGSVPKLEDRLGLTVYGLAQVGDTTLLPAFLAALAWAVAVEQEHPTAPHEVRPLIVAGPQVMDHVRVVAGYRGSGMPALLAGEPAVWAGVAQNGPGQNWNWDLSHAGLQRFAGVRTVQDYLERLHGVVGWPQLAPAAAAPLPPLALPEALDHLDAQWRLATGHRLLHTRRTEAAAVLAQPVNSRAELRDGLSAFADLLDGLEPGGNRPANTRSLAHLQLRIDELLDPEDLQDGLGAVDVLRSLVRLRADGQHSGSGAYRQAQQARAALGLPHVAGSPEQEWETIRHSAVRALRTLRLAIGRAPQRRADSSAV